MGVRRACCPKSINLIVSHRKTESWVDRITGGIRCRDDFVLPMILFSVGAGGLSDGGELSQMMLRLIH
jgi:hypothetical protein